MRTARLVGLSLDGKSLIVATDDGEELQIAADDRLRAAIRGDRPRLGQLEIEMKTSLSPRDIQTRIRAGESLEDVTRLAGIPLDRVERFAAPVLAEREHIAAVAMSASVRRRGETSGHRSLRITVTERLVTRGVDIDTVRVGLLPPRRRPLGGDGRLHLRDGRTGTPASPTIPAAGSRSRPTTRRAGCSASSPAGPQPGRRRPTDSAPAGEDTEPTVDLSDELALVRATREPAAGRPAQDEADEPTVAVPRLLRPVADLPPQLGGDGYSEDSVRVYSGLSDATAVPETGPATGWEPALVVNYPVEPSQQVDSEPPTEPERPAGVAGAARRRPRAPTSSRRRSRSPTLPGDRARARARPSSTRTGGPAGASGPRVPSWDEIMFGGPKRSR